MGKFNLSKSSGKPGKSPKRSLFLKILHGIRIVALTFFVFSISLVLLYRFVSPPFTPLMFWRLAEQKWDGKPFRLEKTWKPLEKISPNLRAAVIISEDQNFFDHHGFDFDAIKNAVEHNQRNHHVLGASTISQQTAKNLFLWPDRSWVRKGLEVYFTVLIELLWSKRRILECYLNEIEMGEGVYGAEAAAHFYFHSNARSLNAEQSAMIAAMLPNPRKWAPPHQPRRVFRRQEWILKQMGNFVGRPELN